MQYTLCNPCIFKDKSLNSTVKDYSMLALSILNMAAAGPLLVKRKDFVSLIGLCSSYIATTYIINCWLSRNNWREILQARDSTAELQKPPSELTGIQ